MSVILNKFTICPWKDSKTYSLSKDYKTDLTLKLQEGNDSKAIKNKLIGSMKLIVEKQIKKESAIKVNYNIDQNGILNIEAIDTKSSKKEFLKIKHNLKQYDKNELKRLRNENQLIYKEKYKKFKKDADEVELTISKSIN